MPYNKQQENHKTFFKFKFKLDIGCRLRCQVLLTDKYGALLESFEAKVKNRTNKNRLYNLKIPFDIWIKGLNRVIIYNQHIYGSDCQEKWIFLTENVNVLWLATVDTTTEHWNIMHKNWHYIITVTTVKHVENTVQVWIR